jgi:hypothetical protein
MLSLLPMALDNVKKRALGFVCVALHKKYCCKRPISLSLAARLGYCVHHKHQHVPRRLSAVAKPLYAQSGAGF